MMEDDGRRYARRDSILATTCTSRGETFDVQVGNVSTGGCLIEGRELALQDGATMRLRIEDIGIIDGKVAWSKGGCAGLEFDQELHEAVVRYIASHTSAEMGRDVTPRDRFGRPLPVPQGWGRSGERMRG